MKLDKEGKLTEPNVGDAELVRFDFDHAGISMHLRLAASEGAIFVLRIVNARWFSFSTDSSQYVIDRIVITENLYEAAAAAPHYVRDVLWRREQRIPGQMSAAKPLKAMHISSTAGPEMLCIADDVAAACMKDVHMRILLDGQHETLAVGDIHSRKTFNTQPRHRVAMLTYRLEWPTPLTSPTSLVRPNSGNN